jgi:1-acyl-sn-glycerol-3-phosphate acyltransferase
MDGRLPDAYRLLRARLHELAARYATPTVVDELPRPDPEVIRQTHAVAGPICDVYFRSEVRRMDRVPDGQTMLVGHHDGGLLPVDAVCFGISWYRRFGMARPLRGLMHEFPFHVTDRLARWLHGIGVVSAAPENLEKLFDGGFDVLLYPGSAREAFRPYLQRREVDLGGRKGFVARALRRGLTVTPIASAGAHETFFILRRGTRLAKWAGIYKHLRADAWPIAAGLPWGLWMGPNVPFLPLPSKVTVEVLPPIDLREALSARLGRSLTAADSTDAGVVQAGYELVRDEIRTAVNRLYDERRFPILG